MTWANTTHEVGNTAEIVANGRAYSRVGLISPAQAIVIIPAGTSDSFKLQIIGYVSRVDIWRVFLFRGENTELSHMYGFIS